jgi:hypothetical protein
MRRGSGVLMTGIASACMLIAGLALLVPGVSAQTPTYPVKPIRLIIGFTPGADLLPLDDHQEVSKARF